MGRRPGLAPRWASRYTIWRIVFETVLAVKDGFYGMVLGGWDIPDFEVRGATGRIPAQAIWVEHGVNLLMVDSLNAPFDGAQGFRDTLATVSGGHVPGAITDAQFRQMRERLATLAGQWRALPPGQCLEMKFECP